MPLGSFKQSKVPSLPQTEILASWNILDLSIPVGVATSTYLNIFKPKKAMVSAGKHNVVTLFSTNIFSRFIERIASLGMYPASAKNWSTRLITVRLVKIFSS
ncbi:MAG: hypothetical protein KME29_07235 [Calothrix sp. FI2-JRJ7]|nr:hypothetical protein [Calothrix sp. FI2-JRJ7]